MKLALHLEGRTVRGGERQALLIVGGLVGRGHDVIVSCRARGSVRAALEGAGARTTGVRPGGDADIFNALRFSWWLRQERPDAILLTSWKRAPVAGWAARRGGVPRIAMRMGGIHRLAGGGRSRLQRLAFTRWYDMIIANSDSVRGHVLRGLPSFPPSAVRVIHNAVEPQGAAPAPIRAELGIPSGAILVVAVGGLQPLKGNDLLAAAVARLDRVVHVVVAGDGTAAQTAAVDAAARAAGVRDRFHLLGRRGDVPGLLAASDIFVHASRTDSLPNALLEAMAAGLPIVATEVGGVREALAPREGRGAAGWIVPREDHEALGLSLAKMVQGVRTGDPGVRQLGAEARWRSERWFAVEPMVDAYEAVLTGEAG